MSKRRLSWLLVASLAISGLACAHREAESYGAAGGVPLGIVDCDDGGDIYAGYGPCTGFVYGDYEQYPLFAPLPRSEVTLTGDHQRPTHVVTRPGFGQSSTDFSSSSGDSSFSGSSSTTSSSPPASTPRMDPAPVSAPAGPVVVSRPH